MSDQIGNKPTSRPRKATPAKGSKLASSSRIPWKLAAGGLAIVVFGAGIGAGFLLWGRKQPACAQQLYADSDPTVPRCLVSADDDPGVGPEDAPILIVEFFDFNCGYCALFHNETFPQLMAAYPGQIRFVFRDYPIVGGFEAAQAAECADEQGAYLEYHDALFSGRRALDRDGFAQYADELGLDSEELLACLDSESQADEVIGDGRYAYSLGASGTPLFFINGIRVEGAQPLENFLAVIESELGKE
jgi:protein-disulfide isomerase